MRCIAGTFRFTYSGLHNPGSPNMSTPCYYPTTNPMSRTLAPLLLLSLLAPLAHASAAPWIEVRSDHFTMVTDAGDKEARRLLDQFERMRWVFQALFPKANIDPVSPIVVIAVRDQKEFQQLEPTAYLAKGMLQLAGYFLKAPDKNYILVRLDVEGEHPYSIVYHEYTHLELGTENMPLWLNEGLAQVFENTEFRNKDVLVGEPSQNNLQFLQKTPFIPLDTLFHVDAESPYYHEEQKGSIFYPESWALTHLLLTSDWNQKTDRIAAYMRLMDQHVDPATAAQQTFGDLKKLQAALSSYTNRMSYTVLKIDSAAAPIDPKSMVAVPITPAQADAYRADVLAYDGRTTDAHALLDEILKTDPNNVLAHETMGFLAFHAGDHAEAKKWYAQAVALDSKSFLAQYYFAMLSLMDGDTGPQAEASLQAAIKLNPRYAPAYDGLAQLYGRRHENLDVAHMMSLQAVELEPDNLNFRLNAANVLMEANRFDDAVHVLDVARSVARSADDVRIVEMRIGQAQVYKDQYAQNQRQEAEAQAQTTVKIISGPGSSTEGTAVESANPDTAAPKHPTETPHGRMLTAWGVVRGVTCSYPAVMTLRLENVRGKPAKTTLSLYNNNYYKVDYSASNFTPKGEVHPCQDLEGMKAEVEYFKTADTTVDGQIVAVMMIK